MVKKKMTGNTGARLQEIQGIGPKISAEFEAQGVRTVLDFLVKPLDFYARIVDHLASRDQVQSWQRMARFLQLTGVDGQIAEALVKARIHTMEQLGNKSATDLRKIFRVAKKSGMIPQVPDVDGLAIILRDANRMAYSRSILGRLMTDENRPVEGCAVRHGRTKTITNSSGFFKIDFIRDDSRALTIVLPDGQIHRIETAGLLSFPEDTEFETIHLTASTKHNPPNLDEFNGDQLPIRQNQEFVIRHESVSELRENDILMVRSFYKSSPHVKLQSVFTAFENGVFIARTYKFPLSKTHEPLQTRARYRYLNGRFTAVGSSLQTKIGQIRVRQLRPLKIPKKVTGKALERLLRQRIKEVLK
ncbi:MAG: DUF4332 domain-containing protein [Pseudomonadota bacterium]